MTLRFVKWAGQCGHQRTWDVGVTITSPRDYKRRELCFFLRRPLASWTLTTKPATRFRSGDGNRRTKVEAFPPPHCFNVYSTFLNRTRSFFVSPLFRCNTSRAMGAHSLLKLQGMSNRLESPLIKIVARPTKTKS